MDFGLMWKIKGLWDRFIGNHPNFPKFIEALRKKGIPEGTNIEIKFEYPDGSRIKGGVIVKQEDLEVIREMIELSKNAQKN